MKRQSGSVKDFMFCFCVWYKFWYAFDRFINSLRLHFSRTYILAKLHAYGFSLGALRLIYSYLTKRKQRTRVNGDYSSWEEIFFGVPHGYMLGPLLVNTFRGDLFLIMKETSFASYADDKTPYVTAENLDEVIKSLEEDSIKLFQWFSDNQMKAKHDKSHLKVDDKNNETMNANGFKIKNTESEKLLGIKSIAD